MNGKNEQNDDERVSEPAKNYEKYHVAKSFGSTTQPISMEMIKVIICISPCALQQSPKERPVWWNVVSIIDITTLVVNIFPQEEWWRWPYAIFLLFNVT